MAEVARVLEASARSRRAALPFRVLSKRGLRKAFNRAVIAGGLSVAAYALAQPVYSEHLREEFVPFLSFLVLALVTQFVTLRLFGPAQISICFPLVVVTLLTMGPGGAILVNLGAGVVWAFFQRRRSLVRIAFGLASLTLSTWTAWMVLTVTGGYWQPENYAKDLLPVLAAVAAYFGMSALLSLAATAMSRGWSLRSSWKSEYPWLWAYYLTQTLLSLAVSVSYQHGDHISSIFSLSSVAVPWLLIRLHMDLVKERAAEKDNLDRLTAMSMAALELSRSHMLEDTLREVTAVAGRLATPDASAIFLTGRDGDELRPAFELGGDQSLPQSPGLGLAREDLATLTAGEPQVTKNVPPAVPEGQGSSSGARPATPTAVYVPLWVDQKIIGAMGLYFKSRRTLSAEESHLLNALAEHAAIAIDRHEKSRELMESSWRLFQTEERVRRQISSTLHGSVQTKIQVLRHRLGQLGEEDLPSECISQLEQVRNELLEVQEQVRTLSANLYPALVKVGLLPALQSLGDRFQGVLEVTVDADEGVEGLDRTNGAIREDTRLVAYRVMEEALTNAAKHAEATGVTVRVRLSNATIHLFIEDNGKGFRMADIVPGLGFRMIREIASGVGGAAKFHSEMGKGTRLEISLPMAQASSRQTADIGAFSLAT